MPEPELSHCPTCGRRFAEPRLPEPIEPRFRRSYAVDPTTGCWQWTAHCNLSRVPSKRTRTNLPYGRIKFGPKQMLAHRVSWILAFGDIPAGLLVLHRCDNSRCVNPQHLFLGTHQDNVDDMRQKGRKVRGERIWSAKITAADVVTIRTLAHAGATAASLGRRYGLSAHQVGAIIRRKKWAHV